MAVSKKEADVQVTFYDVANRTTNSARASAIASKYSTKETVNLCIKERKGMSFELFFLILAAILVFLLIMEFFGIYRPYLALEQAEAQLTEDQARLEQLYGEMSDRESVREQYRLYNYENFPRDLVDRADVLDLLEKEVFPHGKVVTFSITRNALTLTLTGIPDAEGAAMQKALRENKIVQTAIVSSEDEATGIVSMTIIFKDATEVE